MQGLRLDTTHTRHGKPPRVTPSPAIADPPPAPLAGAHPVAFPPAPPAGSRIVAVTAAVLAVVVFVAGVLAGAPAHGSVMQPVDCEQSPGAPQCRVVVGTPGSPSGGGPGECRRNGLVVPCYIEGKGALNGDGCYYQPVGSQNPPPGARTPGSWYVRTCPDGLNGRPELAWIADVDSPISPEVLAQHAIAMLRLPAPQIRVNPPLPAPQVLHVPTWLWVSAQSWRSRSATASLGSLSVTATATASRAVWTPGDGTSVTCAGPGTPWRAGLNPVAPSPTCGHTYRRASAGRSGGHYLLGATVDWNVTWVGGGASGSAGTLSTTGTAAVTAVEAGALNTAPGRNSAGGASASAGIGSRGGSGRVGGGAR